MNRKKIKLFFPNYFLYILFFLYSVVTFHSAGSLSNNIIIGFIINYIFCCFALLKAKIPISNYKVNYYFILFFLIIAPYNQLASGYIPWDAPLMNEEIILTNWLIFFYQISFYIGYNTLRKKIAFLDRKKINYISINKRFIKILTWCSFFSLIVGLSLFKLDGLFIKSNLWDDNSVNTGLLFLLEFLIRSIPVMSLVILLLAKRKKVISNSVMINLYILFLLVITVLLNFPVALSRYLSGAVYLGLLIAFVKRSFWGKKNFDILIIFAITIVFPFFTLFKRNDLQSSLLKLNQFTFGNFNNVDFDAFTLIGRTIRYVGENGLAFGRQIIGALLFFIPRAVIDVKGVPSSLLVAESQRFYFTNLSEPIIGEGYIDFGVIGVITYGLFLGYLICKVDYTETLCSEEEGKLSYIEIIFPFSLGFVVYLLRGALQPVIVRIMGFYLPLILIFIFQKVFLKKKVDDDS